MLSALLLVLAYPKFNFEILAWVALIPLFFALENRDAKQRFFIGYLFGITFFSGVLYWLFRISIPGALALVVVLSIAPALFSLFYLSPITYTLSLFIMTPAAWVATEFFRAHLFTGFPWALLGYSQSLNLPVIQIADITGVYGVSFLVVLVNAGFYAVARKRSGRFMTLFFMFVILVLTWSYGDYRMRRPYLGQSLNVALIQGNIPQHRKWDPAYREYIMDRYAMLTREASRETAPQLVIWPETSVPGYLEEETDLKERVSRLARSVKAPLLVGALRDENADIFNSAILVSDRGEIVQRYHKIHLVPFGEFIPFEKILSRMRGFIDKPIGDFRHGSEFTVFTVQSLAVIAETDTIQRTTSFYTFAPLICFEDIFPALCRIFVKKGAGLLVNMTNDAWFGRTAAPYQHMQHSIFRAVENRVPVVRAANTGVSCIIDYRGNVVSSVTSGDSEIFVEGYTTGTITLPFLHSVYTRFGDLFSWICVLLFGAGLAARRVIRSHE